MRRILPCIILSLLASLCFVAFSSAQTAPASAPAAAPAYSQRWNYGGGDLNTKEGAEAAIELLKQSKAAGCTHMYWNDAYTWRLDKAGPDYLGNVKRFKDTAKELGITICPSMISIGYSGKYCDRNSNLGAGIPVKEMPYVVKNGKAEPDPALALDASKLEFATTMPSFRRGGGEGAGASQPTTSSRPGRRRGASQPASASRPTSGAFGQRGGQRGPMFTASGSYDVKPFMLYRISYVTSSEPAGEGAVAANNDKGRRCAYTNVVWTQQGDKYVCQTMFNTLEGTKINIHIQSSSAIENVKIEPAGMLLILRRDLIPLVVTNEDKSVTYKEGVDFKPVADPIVAVRPFPGEFPMDHPAPVIELTDKSAIKDGQKLLVSFFHHQRIYKDEDCMTLEDPMVWPIFEEEIENVIKVFGTNNYIMNYDEIRVGGWEPMPDPSIKTAGQLLAWHFKKAYDLVRKHAPDATIYTWSDMFTPLHNAGDRGFYYLVNGNWYGSWETMPKDVVIMMWAARNKDAVKFFADRGNKQVICGYYDARDEMGLKRNIRRWINVTDGVPGILGFMYTTWNKNYEFLQDYFKLLDTYSEWSADMPEEPSRER